MFFVLQRTGERPLVRNVPDLLAYRPGGLKPKTAAERTSSDADANTAGMLQLRYVWGFGYTPHSDVRTKVIVSETLLRLGLGQSFDTNSIG